MSHVGEDLERLDETPGGVVAAFAALAAAQGETEHRAEAARQQRGRERVVGVRGESHVVDRRDLGPSVQPLGDGERIRALAASALLRDVTNIRVAGPGSGDIARALRAHHPEARVRLLVPPSQARAAADLAAGDTGAGAGAGEIVVETGGLLDRRPELAEAYLLVGALAEFGDDDAAHVLAEAAASTRGGGVLVLEDPHTDETDDEHELEHDLELLAVHGGALRTESRLDALAEAAGLRPGGREIVGWGRALRRYERV